MIWKNGMPTIDSVNSIMRNTLSEILKMECVELTENSISIKMPVDWFTKQPMGLLHGGASAALAETIGSVASYLIIDNKINSCVGVEINCNHLKPARTGHVLATATPFHIGQSIHVWDIKIKNDANQLVCVSRLTVSVLNRKI